ncbi:MAG: hypothetical protein JXA71_12035 [Chitinispirillaceae bacterium]|nr:hypothetical protein [Chitinispirillaceae bacterium]
MSKPFVDKTVRQQGSVLVGVVAFITLMTIAMGGFLGVARNIISQETLEMNDDRAFLAAESGLLIGTNWLREADNWIQYKNTGYQGTVYQGVINGYTVTVTVTAVGSNQLRITSQTSGGLLPYSKSLSWTVSETNWEDPGVFINDLSGVGGVGGGGLNNEWFDGPVHTNSPLKIASVSGGNVSVRFVNGKVSTYNKLDRVAFDAGHWGNYGTSPVSGNNYDFGIWLHDASAGQYSKLDLFFERNGRYTEFKHSKDSLFMPRITTQTRTLPQNQSATKRALLHFSVLNGTTGQATYYYYDATNQQQSVTFSNDQEIVRVPNDVEVIGTVKGQTTVITDLGYSMYPVGDLKYHGYQPDLSDMELYSSSDNYGLGNLTPLNKDVLALVSGAHIHFGLKTHTFSIVDGNATLTPEIPHGNEIPVMLVTAQLIATEAGCGVRWASTNVNQYDYKLNVIGTRAIDTYEESHNAQGGPGNETFRFFYDARFRDGLKAPGVPSLRANAASGDLFILNTDWTEENKVL